MAPSPVVNWQALRAGISREATYRRRRSRRSGDRWRVPTCRCGLAPPDTTVRAAVPVATDARFVTTGTLLFVAGWGRHARSAAGMGSLPGHIPVEIEAIAAFAGSAP